MFSQHGAAHQTEQATARSCRADANSAADRGAAARIYRFPSHGAASHVQPAPGEDGSLQPGKGPVTRFMAALGVVLFIGVLGYVAGAL